MNKTPRWATIKWNNNALLSRQQYIMQWIAHNSVIISRPHTWLFIFSLWLIALSEYIQRICMHSPCSFSFLDARFNEEILAAVLMKIIWRRLISWTKIIPTELQAGQKNQRRLRTIAPVDCIYVLCPAWWAKRCIKCHLQPRGWCKCVKMCADADEISAVSF
jgi:hypothetical protein